MLLWISRGKSNRDIGEILNISPRTVNKHLEQVFVKLGVENRAAAAAPRCGRSPASAACRASMPSRKMNSHDRVEALPRSSGS